MERFNEDKTKCQLKYFGKSYTSQEIGMLKGKELKNYQKHVKQFEEELKRMTEQRWKKEKIK